MNREIWEFLVKGNDGVIQRWFRDETISKREQAKLDVALNRLRTLDLQLIGGKLLAGPLHGSKIYKLRLRCENRELRPMLCRGPIAPAEEYTLLQGALEVGDKLKPHDAVDRAASHREELLANPDWRAPF
jgi:hypothetical protein